jgi:Uma2 family endonuclease
MANFAYQTMSVDEFLIWCLGQEDRYELVEGQPVKMMAGASNYHDVMTVNITASLHGQLRGKPCRVASADTAVRTRIRSARRPDVTVTCEPPRRDSYEAAAPRLVVEVLSPKNTGVRWQRKLEEYRRREGLQYILLIDSRRIAATLLTRTGPTWEPADFDALTDTIDLPEIACRLAMADVYEGLVFDDAARDEPDPDHF